MPQVDDLSRSLVAFDQDATLIVVTEMSEASWLVAGMAPGVDRQPLKKLGPDPDALLRLVERWRDEAVKAGKMIERIALAFEAGRDGFWLARWLQARGIEVHVIHSTSVAVSREHRRAKTDRLDTAMLMRVFLGWLRSERGHCGMVAIPTLEDEDARRPSRERESLVGERTRIINRMKAILAWLGVRGFNPKLRKAPQRLDDLRTPEDLPLPPTRFMNCGAIWPGSPWSANRSRRLSRRVSRIWNRRREQGRMRWCVSSPTLLVSASKQPTCWFRKCYPVTFATEERWHALPVSPALQMRAVPSGERGGWRSQAMPG
jgi:Transposase